MKNVEVTNNIKYRVLTIFALSFAVFGFLVDTPIQIVNGLYHIIKEPDILITDYIAVGGIGATFVNAGLLTLISIFILYQLKLNISGVAVAAIFLMTGFALFGKNLLNVWLIIMGAFLYAKTQKEKFSKYIYVALFGTSMAPTVTEILLIIDQPLAVRIVLTIVIGLMIGFVLPPLSASLLRVHQGFNLYNVGFTAGMIGTIIVSIFKSYGFVTGKRLVWSTGNDLVLGTFLLIFFALMISIGYYLNGKSLANLKNIFSYSGRLVSDFVMLEGFGVSLINMGLNGLLAMGYIKLAGGAFNGPTIGGILTIAGFGAFGKHFRNIIPIFIGVFLGSLTKTWNIHDPEILLAALFGTGLAPIAGQFGWQYGIIAGFINSSVVLSVGVLHGGLNLYNTGFSAGIVAAVMVPIIEAFRKEEIG